MLWLSNALICIFLYFIFTWAYCTQVANAQDFCLFLQVLHVNAQDLCFLSFCTSAKCTGFLFCNMHLAYSEQ